MPPPKLIPDELLEWPIPAERTTVRVACIIPGEPVSKQRPRFSGKVTYTPSQTSEAQHRIGWFIKSCFRHPPDEQDKFSVRLSFFLKNNQRRDLDNMCKLIFDACNGIVWKDDLQVVELFAKQTKLSDNPRTEVAICSLGPRDKLTSICKQCGKVYDSYTSWKNRKYCSSKCQYAGTYPPHYVTCAGCGNTIRKQKNQLRNSSSGLFYCSMACKDKRETAILQCVECGNTFERPRSLALRGGLNSKKYCSEKCFADFWRKQRAKTAQGVCTVCGGSTTKKQYKMCYACKIQSGTFRSTGKPPGGWVSPEVDNLEKSKGDKTNA